MNTRPIKLTTSARAPPAAFDHRRAAPGRAGRIIDRAHQPRLAGDEDQRLLLVEGVIAERHRVGAGLEKFVADRLGDAEAAGRVLAVDDDDVEPPARPQIRQMLGDRRAARAPDDVADEQAAASAGRLDEFGIGQHVVERLVVRLVRHGLDLADADRRRRRRRSASAPCSRASVQS